MKSLIVPAMAALIALAQGAAANVNVVNAMTCVPSPDTVRQDLYIPTAGGIKFQPGKTGTIVLFCPISALDGHVTGAPATISAAFRRGHSDGTPGDAHGVTVQLRERALGSGNVRTVLTLVSDDPRNTTVGCGGPCIDTRENSYYVQVTMRRPSILIAQPDDIGGGGGGERNVTFSNVTISISD